MATIEKQYSTFGSWLEDEMELHIRCHLSFPVSRHEWHNFDEDIQCDKGHRIGHVIFSHVYSKMVAEADSRRCNASATPTRIVE